MKTLFTLLLVIITTQVATAQWVNINTGEIGDKPDRIGATLDVCCGRLAEFHESVIVRQWPVQVVLQRVPLGKFWDTKQV